MSILSLKQRRTSSTSLTSTSTATTTHHAMFKPPSNLPPVGNSEIIQLDIDTYRLIMQELHTTKAILHKLSYALREPSGAGGGGSVGNTGHGQQLPQTSSDLITLPSECIQPDEMLSPMAANPLISSFYSHVRTRKSKN